ncbi:hypothetical protein QFZ66_008302 [Streptomyces sp. B4I13]|nr:hypothetical protein [Streptomyces sp. B4I13]
MRSSTCRAAAAWSAENSPYTASAVAAMAPLTPPAAR